MHLTVLSDNNGTCDLTGEWGLSILIEYEKHTILLDAGASDLFWDNAQKLGVDLADTDCAVLSHGHWDHANGFVPFLARTRGIPLYLRRSAFDSYWSEEEDGSLKYIGIPQELAQYADRLVYPEGDCQLFDGVWLIPHRMPGREQIGLRERMFRRREGCLEPDDFSHEQSLVLDTPRGLVIFNSCSHAGAAAIIDEVRERLPGRPVYAMIGGFHLHNKPADEVRAFAERLRDSGAQHILTGHCTGDVAFAILHEVLGERLLQFRAGLEAEL